MPCRRSRVASKERSPLRPNRSGRRERHPDSRSGLSGLAGACARFRRCSRCAGPRRSRHRAGRRDRGDVAAGGSRRHCGVDDTVPPPVVAHIADHAISALEASHRRRPTAHPWPRQDLPMVDGPPSGMTTRSVRAPPDHAAAPSSRGRPACAGCVRRSVHPGRRPNSAARYPPSTAGVRPAQVGWVSWAASGELTSAVVGRDRAGAGVGCVAALEVRLRAAAASRWPSTSGSTTRRRCR
jgi:hypothetical protein